MKLQLLVGLMVMCVATGVVTAQEQPPVSAEIVVLRVMVVGFPADSFDLAPFNASPGTAVAVLLRSADKLIVAVLGDKSRIDAFSDDTGADLLEPPPATGAASNQFSMTTSVIGPFPTISNDGKSAVVELTAPSSPADGATSLQLKGTIVMQLAVGTSKITVPHAELVSGAMDVPGYTVAIEQVGEVNWGNGPQRSVTFKVTGDKAEQLAAVRFLNADGSEIQSQRTMRMRMFGHVQVTYVLDKMVDAATIELSFWDGLESVEVPLDMQITLGI